MNVFNSLYDIKLYNITLEHQDQQTLITVKYRNESIIIYRVNCILKQDINLYEHYINNNHYILTYLHTDMNKYILIDYDLLPIINNLKTIEIKALSQQTQQKPFLKPEPKQEELTDIKETIINFGDYSTFLNRDIMNATEEAEQIKQTYINIMNTFKSSSLIGLCIQKDTNKSFHLRTLANVSMIDKTISRDLTVNYDDSPLNIMKLALSAYEKDFSFFEVIRSDYSRLMFDIDLHDYSEKQQFINTLKIITTLSDIFKAPLTGGIIVRNDDCYNYIKSTGYFNNVLLIKQEFKEGVKLVSGHVQLHGIYFNRDDIKNKLFRGLTLNNLKQNELTKGVFDVSIYKTCGSQQNFKMFFSIKPQKSNSKISLTEEHKQIILSYPDYFISQKCPQDREIKDTDKEFYDAYQFIYNTFKNIIDITPIKSKRESNEQLNLLIDSLNIKDWKKVRTFNDWDSWRLKLIKQIKLYLLQHPKTTKTELHDIFINEEYQYISEQGHIKINESATNWCIEKAINSNISLKSFFTYHHAIKYDYKEFRKLINGHRFTLYELIDYINNTFIFFINKEYDVYTLIKQDGKITRIKTKDLYEDDLTVFINYTIDSKTYLRQMTLKEALIKLDNYKNKFDIYDIYSLNDNNYHIYNLPTHINDEVELHEETYNILNLLCNDDVQAVNYVLKWFAYVLQHPEKRNHIALQFVSTVRGVGKNLITNMLCSYLTRTFSCSNLSMEHITDKFNSVLDDMKLVIVNECPKGKKEVDKLKQFITDDEITINEKNVKQITKQNLTNLIILSNYMDTSTIESTDRRISFFYTNLDAFDKSFYDEYYKNYDEHTENFIKFLLSIDLTGYNPDLPCFNDSKKLLYEKRESLRNPIYKLVKELDEPFITLQDIKMIIGRITNGYSSINVNELTDEQKTYLKIIDDYYNQIDEALKYDIIELNENLSQLDSKKLTRIIEYEETTNYKVINDKGVIKVINTKKYKKEGDKTDELKNNIIEYLKQNGEVKISVLIEKYKDVGLSKMNYRVKLNNDRIEFKTKHHNVYISLK